MNKKRWFAIGLSFLIIVMGSFAPSYQTTGNSFDELETANLDLFDQYLNTEDKITETVIEAGNSDSRILELTLDGAIIAQTSNGFGGKAYDHSFFLKQLDLVKADDTIKAIIFVVNTPGGGVFESAEIRRKVLEIQELGVPIYVSMQSIAASGGYYISASADKIYATNETWTGSIGTIMKMMNYKELMDKHGVHMNTFASGDYKNMGSSTAEMTAGERKIFQSLIDESYQTFVDIIVEGRGMSEVEVKKIGDGRIYTAKQALSNGLIDKIAYKEEVLADLRKDYGLEDSEVFAYTKPSLNAFADLFSKFEHLPSGSSELNEIRVLLNGYFNDGAPRAYYLYGGQ